MLAPDGSSVRTPPHALQQLFVGHVQRERVEEADRADGQPDRQDGLSEQLAVVDSGPQVGGGQDCPAERDEACESEDPSSQRSNGSMLRIPCDHW